MITLKKDIYLGMSTLEWEQKYPMLLPYLNNIERVCKYVCVEFLLEVLEMWNQPERHYHNLDHMADLFYQFNNDPAVNSLNEYEQDVLLSAIVYHDAVYDPKYQFPKNEDLSKELWLQHFLYNRIIGEGEDMDTAIMMGVSELIEATKCHDAELSSEIAKLFVRWDLNTLTSSDLTVLINAERKILKEYQFHDYADYRKGRIEVLEKFKPFLLSINPDSKIESLIQYVSARKLKIGIYAGTFHPMHTGHYSIIKRAEKVFDKIIIACGPNPLKPVTLEQKHYIKKLQEEILPYHQVEYFDGLLTDYVQSKHTKYVEPTVIKGLGRPGDFENEKMQMRYMEDMDPTINLSFFISDREFDYVSSTGAKIVEQINPKTYNKYALGNWPDAEYKMNHERKN